MGLPFLQRASYSVGHVLNDLCAACWFSYLLLYLQQVQQLSGAQAGAVLFAGQIADALATPIVGLGSDATKRGLPSLGLGRRKIWNAGGVVLVCVSFFGLFGICAACLLSPPGRPPSSEVKTAVFALAAALFNFGWAAVQVSHMAMVPELTTDESERILLNSARYAFTVLSNVVVFLAMLGLLAAAEREGQTQEGAKYDPQVYTRLAGVVLALGGACSVAFLLGTKERDPVGYSAIIGGQVVEGTDMAGMGMGEALLSVHTAAGEPVEEEAEEHDGGALLTPHKHRGAKGDAAQEQPTTPKLDLGSYRAQSSRMAAGRAAHFESVTDSVSKRKSVMTWRDWVVVWPFYQVMIVYASVRLAVNVSQVYVTFYLTETLDMPSQALAIVPLLSYIAQLLATVSMRSIDSRLGRRRTLTIGSLTTAAASAAMLFLSPASSGVIYPVIMVLGLGCAASSVVSVSLEGDLVGPNTESGAFVYGAMSFADKLVNGVVVLAIQSYGDVHAPPGSPGRASFVRVVTSVAPLLGSLLAVGVGYTIRFPRALLGRAARQHGAGALAGEQQGSSADRYGSGDQTPPVVHAAREITASSSGGGGGRPGTLTRGPSMYAGGVGGAGGRPGFSRGWSALNVLALERPSSDERIPFRTSG